MILCGLDIETPQETPLHGLQPWRARTGEASIKSIAVWEESTQHSLKIREPSRADLIDLLRICNEKKYVMTGWNLVFDLAWLNAYDLTHYLKQLKWLDGMLLLKRYDPWRDKEEGGVGFGLKEAVKEVWPEVGEYAIDATTIPQTEEEWRRFIKYNVKDAMYSTLLTRMYWSALSKQERAGAAIECGNIVDVALSYINGVHINAEALPPFDGDIRERIKENEKILGKDISIVRSPKKLAELIYGEWKYSPLKKTPKGAPATDKESLLKLAIKHSDNPKFAALMNLRKCNTQGTKFVESVRKSMGYHGENVTRPEPIMSGTYCVPGDVEVLTRSGWVCLQDWNGGEILQVKEDLSMSFLPADRFDGGIAEKLICVKHPGMTCMFSLEHTIPHLAQKTDKWSIVKAEEMLNRRLFVPVSGHVRLNGTLTSAQIRLLAAIQADAWFNVKRFRVIFTLKKGRKIERLKELLELNGIAYNEYRGKKYADRTTISIYKGSIPSWVTPDRKYLGAWLLDSTEEALKDFIKELEYWDGCAHEDGGCVYYSSIESNADWVCTIAALTGFKARKHAVTKTGVWPVHISDEHVRPIANIIPKTHVSEINRQTHVYCTVTQTGFWLARSKGTIFITGNSHRFTYSSFQGKNKDRVQTGIALHQWERGKAARNVLQAPEGFLLAEFDFSGQEMRLMAIESEDEVMLNLFAKNEDLHAYMGAYIENMDYKHVRENAKDDAKAYSARNLGKFSNLSLQYRIGIDSIMSRALTQYGLQLTREKAEHIKYTYMTTYKAVPAYWKEAIRRADMEKYAFSRGGARVPLNNLNDYAQQQIAINFRIQCTGAEMKLLGIYMCRPLFDADLMYAWDLHDALFMYVRDDDRAEAKVRKIKNILSNLPYKDAWGWDVPIPLPVDAKLGKTWGTLKEIS